MLQRVTTPQAAICRKRPRGGRKCNVAESGHRPASRNQAHSDKPPLPAQSDVCKACRLC